MDITRGARTEVLTPQMSLLGTRRANGARDIVRLPSPLRDFLNWPSISGPDSATAHPHSLGAVLVTFGDGRLAPLARSALHGPSRLDGHDRSLLSGVELSKNPDAP